MSRAKLRHAIAVESARLILRNEETDYRAARRRAARWLSKRKLDSDDLPTRAEIDEELLDLSGLFVEERQTAAVRELRHVALELAETLAEWDPRLTGSAVSGPVTVGSRIELSVAADDREAVLARLADVAPETVVSTDDSGRATARFHLRRFPCLLRIEPRRDDRETSAFGLDELQSAIEADAESTANVATEEEVTADAFAFFRMLLARLEDVRLDSQRHPEGDALYHSLQVFELGREERPWDEEFLLACLLHDSGLAIDPRRRVESALETLGDLITDRTAFLIEHLPRARDYLQTGRLPKSLRNSEHCEELVLLARCDLAGRVAGAETRDLDEALEYVAGLEEAWDDV